MRELQIHEMDAVSGGDLGPTDIGVIIGGAIGSVGGILGSIAGGIMGGVIADTLTNQDRFIEVGENLLNAE